MRKNISLSEESYVLSINNPYIHLDEGEILRVHTLSYYGIKIPVIIENSPIHNGSFEDRYVFYLGIPGWTWLLHENGLLYIRYIEDHKEYFLEYREYVSKKDSFKNPIDCIKKFGERKFF